MDAESSLIFAIRYFFVHNILLDDSQRTARDRYDNDFRLKKEPFFLLELVILQ